MDASKKLYGEYNACEYRIIEAGTEGILYQAGNSALDSQQYVSANEGVGIKTMKDFCTQTLAEMCDELNAKKLGVQILEN